MKPHNMLASELLPPSDKSLSGRRYFANRGRKVGKVRLIIELRVSDIMAPFTMKAGLT